MFDRVFLDHPRTVGESYGEHLVQASTFSARLLFGAAACFVHALIPCACKTTGSDTIRDLHARMIENRHRQTHRRTELPAGTVTGSE